MVRPGQVGIVAATRKRCCRWQPYCNVARHGSRRLIEICWSDIKETASESSECTFVRPLSVKISFTAPRTSTLDPFQPTKACLRESTSTIPRDLLWMLNAAPLPQPLISLRSRAVEVPKIVPTVSSDGSDRSPMKSHTLGR